MIADKGNVGVVLLARSDSRRFPKKIFANLAGIPIIKILIERLSFLNSQLKLIIATSDRSIDDPLSEFCKSLGVSVFRGSSENVVERFILAAKSIDADFAFRVNGDSPLIAQDLFNLAIEISLKNQSCFVTTKGSKLPYGIGIELVHITTLEQHIPFCSNSDKEHVTSILYRSDIPVKFLKPNIVDISDLNFTVDLPSDIIRIENILNLLPNKDILTVDYLDFVKLRGSGIV